MLFIMNTYSGWLIVEPTEEKSVHVVAEILLNRVLPTYRYPSVITTDRGSEFMNQILKRLFDRLHIKHVVTFPFRPTGNSENEKSHGCFQRILWKLVQNNPACWDQFIPIALSAMRFMPNSSRKKSAYFLTFGHEPALPLDALFAPSTPYYGECETHLRLDKAVRSFYEVYANLHNARKKYRQRANAKNNAQQRSF